MNENNENNFDVVVVGGGAAGLSAALVLGRARRRVAVVDAGTPRNAPAAHMQGFLSRDGMAPADLLAAGRIRGGRLRRRAGRRSVADVRGRLHRPPRRWAHAGTARRVLIATGLSDALPDIPGVRERWGRDLLHCPYCHGWEVRDQPLGVLGTNPAAVEHALLIRQWSDDIVFFTHTYPLTADERAALDARGVGVIDGLVARLSVVDDRLEAVQLTDGRAVPRAAVFIRPAFHRHKDDPLDSLGCELDESGFVQVDGTGRTSVPGVWAAGNVANPRAQVITAAGEGSTAAICDQRRPRPRRRRTRGVGEPFLLEQQSMNPKGPHMATTTENPPGRTPPPSKHQLALMIWLCVFPTLTAINVAFADWLGNMTPVLRTFVLATIAVPIVIYGLMPHLHRLRVRVLTARRAS